MLHNSINKYVIMSVKTIIKTYTQRIKTVNATMLYAVVSQQFDKHLYLRGCLNTHNHNTCIHLQNMAFFITCQDRQT